MTSERFRIVVIDDSRSVLGLLTRLVETVDGCEPVPFTDALVALEWSAANEADLVIVVPATADLLARAASGRADDLLTSVLLTYSLMLVTLLTSFLKQWELRNQSASKTRITRYNEIRLVRNHQPFFVCVLSY